MRMKHLELGQRVRLRVAPRSARSWADGLEGHIVDITVMDLVAKDLAEKTHIIYLVQLVGDYRHYFYAHEIEPYDLLVLAIEEAKNEMCSEDENRLA